jgi:hypothetical protein
MDALSAMARQSPPLRQRMAQIENLRNITVEESREILPWCIINPHTRFE